MEAVIADFREEPLNFFVVGDCSEAKRDHIPAPERHFPLRPRLDSKRELATWPRFGISDYCAVVICLEPEGAPIPDVVFWATLARLLMT